MAGSNTRPNANGEYSGGFTKMMNHHLRNKELSLRAVGLLSKMISLPPDWDFSLKGLSMLNTDGVDAIRSAMKELEDFGYVIREQSRGGNGKMSHSRYKVVQVPPPRVPPLEKPSSESPSSENPTTVKPTPVRPTPENPAQINTNQVTTKEINNSQNNYQSINLDRTDEMELRESYKEIIWDNLELDILSKDKNFDSRTYELVDIMLDVICSTRPTIRINGEDMPQEVVKSRFLKLNSSHIEYVLHAMDECPSDIRNIRAYMLTTLYNASMTMDSYYSARVNHDFYGGSKKEEVKSYDYTFIPGQML